MAHFNPSRKVRSTDRMCCICHQDLYTSNCPHPWKVPFIQWPQHLLREIQQLVPRGPSPGS